MLPETVRANDELYRALLELSAEAIARFEIEPGVKVDLPHDEQVEAVLDQARVVECNDAFAALYGRRPAEMLGRGLSEFSPPGERRGQVARFLRGGYRIVDAEVEHELPDGTTRWVGGGALGLVAGGQLHGYWVALHDITDRKRAEAERERGDRILEAVAFGAARLLEPGTWTSHAGDVLARLGAASGGSRAWVGQVEEGPAGSRIWFRASWGVAGLQIDLDDPRIRDGVAVTEDDLGPLTAELRAGRPLVALTRSLNEDSLARRMGSKGFAAVPITVHGQWWGFLGFGETRHEREWSGPELEALKAAAAVFAAAIERDAADRALTESEERFKRLSAAAFEGVAITEKGVFVDVNEQMAGMLGYAVDDLLGRRVEECVAESDRAFVAAQRASGSEQPFQHLACRRNGSTFPVEVRARSIPYAGRSIRVSAIRDISEQLESEERQRHMEADLRHAAEEWRQTFDALDLGIVLADARGRVVRLNRAALALAVEPGFASAVGRNLEELADREPWRTGLDIHRRVLLSESSVVDEVHDAATGRSFYLLGSPWFRVQGEAPWCVLTFRDVTDYTTMQAQLRRARTLEAMGSLVAGVAHEVRNPLFSISATVDALEGDIGLQPEFAEYAGLLRSQVGRLTQLMRDLLDYGKPSVLRRAPTSLSDVVRRAARSCAGLARERQVRVVEEVGADVPSLDVEGARLEQALENLLANAIQHSPPGGAVRIGVVLDGAAAPAQVRCRVEDEGPGIPPSDLEQLFVPFFSRRKGGTGLGLPIVQRVAEAHGGRVVAENRPGGGAAFTLILPAAAPGEGTAHG
jgi:PAS domain S-box-containing protein